MSHHCAGGQIAAFVVNGNHAARHRHDANIVIAGSHRHVFGNRTEGKVAQQWRAGIAHFNIHDAEVTGGRHVYMHVTCGRCCMRDLHAGLGDH